MARAVKSSEEMKCINASLRATENGVAKLRAAIGPGMTENELWSVLHQSVIAQNADYCETRLLTATTPISRARSIPDRASRPTRSASSTKLRTSMCSATWASFMRA